MGHENSESLDASLVRTIAESDLAEVGVDAVDAALDDLPVPVFSTLRKLYRGARSVQHYFYVKKVLLYLREIQTIPTEERRSQLDKLLSSEERQKFGEHVALVLDRLNDIDKARLMGLVSRAFLEERITFAQLRSLNFVIDAIDPRLIPSVKTVCDNPNSANLREDEQTLLAHGLLTMNLDVETESISVAGRDGMISSSSGSLIKGARITYTATELGYLFYSICLSCNEDAT